MGLTSRLRWVSSGLAAIAALLASADAHAVGTRTFDLDSLEKLQGGELDGVSIASDGVVRAGLTFSKVPLPEHVGEVLSSLVLADGSVLLGTGHDGKVIKVARGIPSVFAETKETLVLSLAQGKDGTVFAGTTGGKIFKVAQGSATEFASFEGMDSVNALAFDRAGQLLAATGVSASGTQGKVFTVRPGKDSTVLFSTDDPFVVALAVADNGDVYAGTNGKGLVYKFENVHKATILFDPPGEEVKGIAIAAAAGPMGPKGTVYAIANEYGEVPEGPRSIRMVLGALGGGAGKTPAGPGSAATPRPKQGKGALWRFDAAGRPEKLMHHDEFTYASLALDPQSIPHVGTGAEGRVYSVDEAHVVTLVVDTDERQVGAMQLTGQTRFVATTDPAVYHEVVPVNPQVTTTWTSKVEDAGVRARFGHVTSRSAAGLVLSTRTGNTPTPDGTWDKWKDLGAGGTVVSDVGRFFQVRASFRDRNALLADLVVPFQTENLRPVVLEVAAHPKSAPEHTAPPKDALPASGGEPPKHDSVLKVSWKVDNPDNDSLRYRVSFQKEGQTTWRDATKPDEVLTKPEYEWETVALPEGKYHVKVDASDELANPPGDVLSHALVSGPVLVDNTPPRIEGLAVAGRRLRAHLVDGLGPIARAEIAVDGRTEWRPIGPKDGLFDTAAEDVDADVSALVPPGAHIVAVRVFDAAGNATVEETETR